MKNVKVKKLKNSTVELTIQIDKKDLKKAYQKAINHYAKETSLPGFRPGKAPKEKVIEKVGEEKIFNHALENAVNDQYFKALFENKLNPVSQPKIDLLDLEKNKTAEELINKDLTFKATVEIFPEIKLADLSKIKKEKVDLSKIDIKDKEVNDVIKKLIESKIKLITVNREAKKGDRVVIDLNISQNNVPIEGGTSKDMPLVIGEKSYQFIPGLEDKLLGMKADKEKEFKLKFPKDFKNNQLKGKEADFKVKMKLVQKRELPEINDELAKEYKFESLKDFKKNIKNNLKKEKEDQLINKKIDGIVNQIIEKSKIEISKSFIEREKEQMYQEFVSNVKNYGLTEEQYLGHLKTTKEKLMSRWDVDAKKRLSLALVFDRIAQNKKITPSKEEVEAEKKNMELTNPNLREQDPKRVASMATGVAANKKVIGFLKKEFLTIKE
jgi:trigger factor